MTKKCVMIKAEIISIGDELLIGQTINTNAAWLGQQLSDLGIRVENTIVIPDEQEAIYNSFDTALNRADIVIVTGGLGPTKDDITKKVICDFFQTELIMNEEVLSHVKGFFERRNRPMLEVNAHQGLVPKTAQVLFNEIGTAPGMWLEKAKSVLISMPGVPYEMKNIFLNKVIPKISNQFETSKRYYRTLLTQGIGESFLAEMLKDWEDSLRNDGLNLAYLPSPGMVKLRVSSYNGIADEVKINGYAEQLKQLLPNYIYGEGEQQLHEVVGEILVSKGQTIGTVESCTGGAIAATLTSVSGSSRYVQGSIVAYSNELKTKLVGVPAGLITEKGAVSQEVVENLATNGKKVLGVDWCIATSGVAGPTGGTDEKPVGTIWLAIVGKGGVSSWKLNLGDNRERTVQITVLTALNMLRCQLLEISNKKKQD